MKKTKYLSLIVFMLIISASPLFAETFYNSPGIVARLDGDWVGSDHLFNLTNKLDVTVEILKPSDITLPITEEQLKSRIVKAFEAKGILQNPEEVEPPLPFFHMLLMIYPLQDGYAIYCDGRLFEKVEIDRISLPDGTTFQAITWERQNLILSPKNRIVQEINSCVDDIVKSFIDRFEFFKNIKTEDDIK